MVHQISSIAASIGVRNLVRRKIVISLQSTMIFWCLRSIVMPAFRFRWEWIPNLGTQMLPRLVDSVPYNFQSNDITSSNVIERKPKLREQQN